MSPPTKLQRDECWLARDVYFKCLDQNRMWLDGIKPATMEEILKLDVASTGKSLKEHIIPSKECTALRKIYESKCLPSWQQHFLTERMKEKQKRFLQAKIEREEMDRNTDSSDFWDRMKGRKE